MSHTTRFPQGTGLSNIYQGTMYDTGNDPSKTNEMIVCIPKEVISLSKVKIELFRRMKNIPRSDGFYVLEMKGKAISGCDRYEGYVSPSLGLASVLSNIHIPPDIQVNIPQHFSRDENNEPRLVIIIRYSCV